MTKLIPLNPIPRGLYAIVDDEDYDFLMQWRWECHPKQNNAYRPLRKEITRISMHRLIMNPPDDMVIDHINHNRLDNRRCNLRICTVAENNFNCRARRKSSSPFKGVSWGQNNNKWHAMITFNRKTEHIGYFSDETEAAKAYDRKAREYFGNFAYLNFPEATN